MSTWVGGSGHGDDGRPSKKRRKNPPAEQTFADVLNGFSLDSGRVRRKHAPGEERQLRDQEHADRSGALPRSRSREFPERLAESEPHRAPDREPEGETASMVRAYAWTGGRTKSDYQFEIETLVSTSYRAYDVLPTLQVEYQAVASLCHEPKSVAEVAALLTLPLGVMKVLLGDMARLGLIDVHRTGSGGDVPDLELFQRVLAGLRRLSSSV
jgi:hypothetical protein